MPDLVIEECRQRFGTPPRRHGFFERFHLTAQPPTWMRMHPRDPLWDFYTQQKQSRTSGEIIWGHIVQANSLLFRPGNTDCPAEVVYSLDDVSGGNVTYLHQLAAVMFRLKGRKLADPALAGIGDYLASETERRRQYPVPSQLAGRDNVFGSTLMVVRKHLPVGYLRHSCFPLLVDRSTSFPMILSWRYWPQTLVDAWCTGS